MSTSASDREDVVLKTEIPGLPLFVRGKVRDVYDLGDRLLLVATDRISAFDSVLPTGIPDKGKVLNQLSAFWFGKIAALCPTHFLTIDPGEIETALSRFTADIPRAALAGRSMLGIKARALSAEFVVRAYLEGSAWKEYRQSGGVCGIALPPGLERGSPLPEPTLTPATKAGSGHDVNITRQELLTLGDRARIEEASELSMALYRHAADYARERGILIADTKFEFGVIGGRSVLIDECLTPDSSRFWDAAAHRRGNALHSLDKQFVRDYLDASGWDREPPAPELPEAVARQTSERYREIYRRLTGEELS